MYIVWKIVDNLSFSLITIVLQHLYVQSTRYVENRKKKKATDLFEKVGEISYVKQEHNTQ